jgi:hypothetical protein
MTSTRQYILLPATVQARGAHGWLPKMTSVSLSLYPLTMVDSMCMQGVLNWVAQPKPGQEPLKLEVREKSRHLLRCTPEWLLGLQAPVVFHHRVAAGALLDTTSCVCHCLHQ